MDLEDTVENKYPTLVRYFCKIFFLKSRQQKNKLRLLIQLFLLFLQQNWGIINSDKL